MNDKIQLVARKVISFLFWVFIPLILLVPPIFGAIFLNKTITVFSWPESGLIIETSWGQLLIIVYVIFIIYLFANNNKKNTRRGIGISAKPNEFLLLWFDNFLFKVIPSMPPFPIIWPFRFETIKRNVLLIEDVVEALTGYVENSSLSQQEKEEYRNRLLTDPIPYKFMVATRAVIKNSTDVFHLMKNAGDTNEALGQYKYIVRTAITEKIASKPILWAIGNLEIFAKQIEESVAKRSFNQDNDFFLGLTTIETKFVRVLNETINMEFISLALKKIELYKQKISAQTAKDVKILEGEAEAKFTRDTGLAKADVVAAMETAEILPLKEIDKIFDGDKEKTLAWGLFNQLPAIMKDSNLQTYLFSGEGGGGGIMQELVKMVGVLKGIGSGLTGPAPQK